MSQNSSVGGSQGSYSSQCSVLTIESSFTMITTAVMVAGVVHRIGKCVTTKTNGEYMDVLIVDDSGMYNFGNFASMRIIC